MRHGNTIRRHRFAAAAYCGALLLSGCDVGSQMPGSAQGPVSPAGGSNVGEVPIELGRASQAAESPPLAADSAAAPAAAPSLGVRLLDRPALVGLAPPQAEFLLGRPTETRNDPPAVVWIYRDGVCSVNLYFFASVETTALKVLALDVTAANDTNEAQNDCYDKVVSNSHERR